MISEKSAFWGEGKQYLARLDLDAEVQTSAGTEKTRIGGELIVRLHGDHATAVGIAAPRFAIAGRSVKSKSGATGVFSVIGERGEGAVHVTKEGLSLKLDIQSKLNTESLDRARAKNLDKGCYHEPVFEPAVAHVTARVAEEDGVLTLQGFDLRVVCAAGDAEEILLIRAKAASLPLQPMLPSPGSLADRNRRKAAHFDNNNDCDPSLQVNRRRLIVQPVGFRASTTDTNPSGSTATAQLAEAQTVWAKACIDLDIRPIQILESATLKTSGDPTAIRASYTDSDPNVIEVYFVQNSLPGIGGGSAGAIGVASCKVVIAEPNNLNPVLLSHELGHVLGLQHPGFAGSNSDRNTVMVPTGSASNPGNDRVTHFMCTNIANPVLQTTTNVCCLSHDTPDHYLRDFPVDVGTEPSDPLPAGMNRYAMSNVWNRLTETEGTDSPTTGPDHQGPARFQSDGVTARTNYMYARVEQLVDLPVHGARVRFYMKHPGSGGGATALQLLGSAPLADTTGLGGPRTVHLGWQVPAGTPNHACVFAVVDSPAEPEGDQTGRDWWQFEQLAHEDNDWAQRNLEITNVAPPGSGNAGDESSNVRSAPWIIRIPVKEGYEASHVELRVDARGAAGLASLALEIPGRERIDIPAGKQVTVQPKTLLTPGEDFVVVIQAMLPAGAPVGRVYGVSVEPTFGKKPLVGFATQFRVARPREVIAQVMDIMMAAIADLATFSDLRVAGVLERRARAMFAEPPRTLAELAHQAVKVVGLLDESVAELGDLRAAGQLGVRESLSEHRGTLERFEAGQGSAAAAVSAFQDIVKRLQMVAFQLVSAPAGDTRKAVRVILDRLEVLYDHDLIGPGECYFTAEVEDGHGRTTRTRFPEKGTYRINAGCRAADVQLGAVIYEGDPAATLRVVLEGREVDIGGEDRFTRYERSFSGSFAGNYGPGATPKSREGMPDWRVFYRID